MTTVGPTPDRDDYEHSEYQDTLRGLGIPPYPAVKPYTPTQSVSPVPAPLLGPKPWSHYEQDPNRPPPEPVHEMEHDAMHAAMVNAMHKLDVKDSHWRFHGKASPYHLVMMFNDMRFARNGSNVFEGLRQTKRNEYWMVPEW